MDTFLGPFLQASRVENGYALANALDPFPQNDPGRLYVVLRATNDHSVQRDIQSSLRYSAQFSPDEQDAWTNILTAYWMCAGPIIEAQEAMNQARVKDWQWARVYEAWKDLANVLIRNYQNGSLPVWTLPYLYLVAKYLRKFALIADEHMEKARNEVTFSSRFDDAVEDSSDKNIKLQDSVQVMNKMFGVCASDRSPAPATKKWGTYYIANLQFKTYFRLKRFKLSDNVVRSINALRDLPALAVFPMSHQVTYNYYLGVLAFFNENYPQAEKHLMEALQWCHKDALKNLELILTYLIPSRLVASHKVPSAALLALVPRLQAMFAPLVACIKRGDLSGFDQVLVAREHHFVQRRIYLALERSRDVAVRNLFRKVYLAGGYDPLKEGQTEADRVRRTRIPIAEFVAAVEMGQGGHAIDPDEVECMLVNVIYKGLMKGYISREHQMVVLNKKGAFPGTGI